MHIASKFAETAANFKARLLRLLAKAQCGTGNNEHPRTSYGYVQLDNSAKWRKKRLSTLRDGERQTHAQARKRWVALPNDAKVESGPLRLRSDLRSKENAAPTMRSCLKRVVSDDMKPCPDTPRSNASTVDTLSHCRRVVFCDEVVSGGADSSLAEWFFVDRDICGISLYNYDPCEAHLFPYEYFLSSPYGRLFQKELSALHYEESVRRVSNRETEEKTEFDDALKLAGVDERLVEQPDVYPRLCLRSPGTSNG